MHGTGGVGVLLSQLPPTGSCPPAPLCCPALFPAAHLRMTRNRWREVAAQHGPKLEGRSVPGGMPQHLSVLCIKMSTVLSALCLLCVLIRFPGLLNHFIGYEALCWLLKSWG